MCIALNKYPNPKSPILIQRITACAQTVYGMGGEESTGEVKN